MNILRENKSFRALAISAFFNKLGSSMYNLVFVSFAATMPNNKLAVGIANIIVLIPVFFTLFIGIKADETKLKRRWLILLGFVQSILFILVGLLTQTTTWLAFSIICLINIVSDIISDYRGGLELPIFQHTVKQENLIEAHSVNQFISYVCNFSGQALGVYVLTISNDNFGLVAVFNALSFFASSFILIKYKKFLLHTNVEIYQKSFVLKIKETYLGLKEVFQKSEKTNFTLMLLSILLINALGSGFSAIYYISFLKVPLFGLTFSQSVFILQIIMILFSIIGTISPHDYFSKLRLISIIFLDSIIIFAISLNNSLGGPQVLSMLGLAFLFYLSGKINPKINSLLMSSLPSELLARSGALLSLLFMLAMPIGNIIFTIFSLFAIQSAWLLYSICAFIVLLLTLKLTNEKE